jgi:hypothetical protein
MRSGDITNELLDMLRMFKGMYPYNGFNPCSGDMWYFRSIEQKYTDSAIDSAVKLLNMEQQRIAEFSIGNLTRV